MKRNCLLFRVWWILSFSNWTNPIHLPFFAFFYSRIVLFVFLQRWQQLKSDPATCSQKSCCLFVCHYYHATSSRGKAKCTHLTNPWDIGLISTTSAPLMPSLAYLWPALPRGVPKPGAPLVIRRTYAAEVMRCVQYLRRCGESPVTRRIQFKVVTHQTFKHSNTLWINDKTLSTISIQLWLQNKRKVIILYW